MVKTGLFLMMSLLKRFRAEMPQRRVQPATIVARFDVEEKVGFRCWSAIFSAWMVSAAVIRSAIAQPTRRRVDRSRIAVKYSRPSNVGM